MSTTSPHDSSERNKLRTHTSKSSKFGGGSSCPSGVTVQEVTKELANALPQASILDQRRRQAKNEDRRSNGGASRARAPANELTKSTASLLQVSSLRSQVRGLRSRPISTSANFDFGQFWPAPLTIQNVKMKKKRKKKKEKKKRQGRDSQCSPCLCEGVVGRMLATRSHKHGLCLPVGTQQAFMWSIAGRRLAMLHMNVC